jgi:hypothetical protein
MRHQTTHIEYKQGDQIGNFLPSGLLLEVHYDFWKDEVAQNNGNILGYFLFWQIYYIFT